nr:PREDICTED: uncharacterized protein LOC107079189 [Lepisosteus oculatus]XP_015216997.1 PREDICTED: uncharacterized protein LOC107079189 [Lepisosteus oculatus]
MSSEVRQSFVARQHVRELHEDKEEEEGEEESDDWCSCLMPCPLCPSCGQPFDLPLLLPCSHSLCRGCVFRAGHAAVGISPTALWSCALLCPGCHFPVELPSLGWAGAADCLPVNPALQGTGPLAQGWLRGGGAGHGRKQRPFVWERSRVRTGPAGLLEDESGVAVEDSSSGHQQQQRELGGLAQAQEKTVLLKTETGEQEPTTLQVVLACAGESATEKWEALCGYPKVPPGGCVALLEEDMEKSVRGLEFTLDPQTAPPPLRVSPSGLTVTFLQTPADPRYYDSQIALSVVSLRSGREELHPLPRVSAGQCIARGQFYWEVDVCNSTSYRIGVCSADGTRGWWLERQGSLFSLLYDGFQEQLRSIPPHVKTVGVFLNLGGGALSFQNVLVQEHLATLPTRFGGPVRPALCLGQGRLRLHCGLPPPPHVFANCLSAYRGPRGAGAGRWRRDVPFQSVRSVIQKFEELSVSDSDSGLVSNFGSCSTLSSFSGGCPPGSRD